MKECEVVISGLAGTFPECTNVKILEEKLFSDENLVTPSDQKWKLGSLNIPAFSGKMKDPFHFDQTFFGVHRKLCIVMDVHAKHCMEKTYEAICDAGINPRDLSGKKVAVLMSSMTSETEYGSVMVSKNSGHAMLGHSRCMQSNRISYFFNFKGPSFVLDSSWVGCMQALEIATKLVAKRQVKLAVVGASNLIVYPEISIHYESMKRLNPEGKTKSFSSDALGYNRSDGIVVFIVQRAEDALRSYGTLVKVECTTEMCNPSVLADPTCFGRFIKNFYSDLPIKNSDIGYIEGDGSASLRLDAMELNALTDVLCQGRDKPLLVGSCKSRIGHCESSAAFMSIVNALIAFKTGYIPSCLHFSAPNPLVPALEDGRMKVVTEKTPLEGDYIGVNTIGVVSIFAHVLLKRNPKSGAIKDKSYFPADGIPRLFLISGRHEEIMKNILKKVEENPVDENYYALNHRLFRNDIPKHLYRGYSVVGKNHKSSKVISYPGGAKQPIWFIFSGMGSQWNEMGTSLMRIPVIRRAINKCHTILQPKGIDLVSIITSKDPSIYDDILHAFVGIAAIQIGLIDLLYEMGIEADGIVGHSVGELGCSYADKCLTAEQVILAAYARGRASNEAKLITGMMAAVGKSYAEIKGDLPDGIEVACHNSSSSCTLSGPVEIMNKYVEQLKSRGIFAKLVNVANIAYHSKHIAPAAPYLLKYLKEIIPEPKLRSEKWVSSSVPEAKWDTELAKYCSAEYHTNNLLSYVLFEEATAFIPKNAICIEIAPHGLLQAILKRSLPNSLHIPLTNRAKADGCLFLVETLGNLFVSGVQMDLSNLYPPVEFPVSRETDYLNLITWDHSEIWYPLVLQLDMATKITEACWKEVVIQSNREDALDFPAHNLMFGQTFYPKSKLLVCMMDYLKENNERSSTNFKSYVFQNIKFQQDLLFDRKENTNIVLFFQKGTGMFEILFGEDTLMTGQLNHSISPFPVPCLDSSLAANRCNHVFIDENQIYQYFKVNDCFFSGPFRNISSITIFDNGFVGKVKWMQNVELYFDALFKLFIFYSSVQQDKLMDLESIYQLMFDPYGLPEHNQDIDVFFDESMGCLVSQAVRIMFFKVKPTTLRTSNNCLELKYHQFVPFSKANPKFQIDFTELWPQLFKENSYNEKLNFYLIVDKSSSFCENLAKKMDLVNLISQHEIYLHQRNGILETSLKKGSMDNYLIICENGLKSDLIRLMKSNTQFYLMHCGTAADLNKDVPLNQLTLIYEQKVDGRPIFLYKQKKTSFDNYEFINVSLKNIESEIDTIMSYSKSKTCVIVYRYHSLSEVFNVIRSHFEKSSEKFRLFFIDNACPEFNIKNAFYQEQLAKDLKINIFHKGIWGSLRDKTMPSLSNVVTGDEDYKLSLNKVSCKEVDLKAVALNLQSLVSPKRYRKFGVVEFSGAVGNEKVFGLGQLAEENVLETDPLFCWKKPKNWTANEAATVPLFYCIAYDMLVKRVEHSFRPNFSVLIHAGHTPFSQAIINVALSLGKTIYTTCFSKLQRQFILKQYPQIPQTNVFLLDETQYVFVDELFRITEGEGPKIVIDPLEDEKLRNQTLQCVGFVGICYIVTNENTDTNYSFGMNMFLNEAGVIGYNPQQILELKDEEKLQLSQLLCKGIESNVVKPLDMFVISKDVSRSEAADTVIGVCQEELPKKVVLPVNTLQMKSNSGSTNEMMKKVNYMIIGSFNHIWFDLLKWLISRDDCCIHVILNQDELPQYIKKRLKNFLTKHKYIQVQFNGIENLNTLESCSRFIKSYQNGSTIDSVFYIKPGYEKQMSIVDEALRLSSKSSCLITIGNGACSVAERRRDCGLKAASFVFKKECLKSDLILTALNAWFKNKNETSHLIQVNKAEPNRIIKFENLACILPSSDQELSDLFSSTVDIPHFVEIPTKCPTRSYSRDLNPVFLFPGFKVAEVEKFSAQLMYPTFAARYPFVIKSLDDTAAKLTKEMVKNFDYSMFTLISEGWSGPLVLKVAELLEHMGKESAVILLDAAPQTIKQWNLHQSSNIVHKYIPNIKEDTKVSVGDVRRWSAEMSRAISKDSEGEFTEDEILPGLETLANWLEAVESFSCKDKSLNSTVHLFTSYNIEEAVIDLKSMCTSFYHHVLESSEPLLSNASLIDSVNNLPLVEYKMAARKQIVHEIATLKLLGE